MKEFEAWSKFKQNKLAKAKRDVAKIESELKSPEYFYKVYQRQCGADKKKTKQDVPNSVKKNELTGEVVAPKNKEGGENEKKDWFR